MANSGAYDVTSKLEMKRREEKRREEIRTWKSSQSSKRASKSMLTCCQSKNMH
jgi:hypothetical protein